VVGTHQSLRQIAHATSDKDIGDFVADTPKAPGLHQANQVLRAPAAQLDR
jgi:hypothetical protein